MERFPYFVSVKCYQTQVVADWTNVVVHDDSTFL